MQIKKSDSPLENYINSTPEISGKAFSEMLNPPRGIKFTIWENLSEIIGGFRMNEFSLLCGTTGTGKSDLIANISANLCLNQVPHLVFSVETGDTDFWIRTFSVLTGKEYNDGNSHDLKELKSEYKKWSDVIDPYLYVTKHDDRIEIEHLKSLITYAVETRGIKFIIMDNLNFFMQPSSDKGVNFEIDRIIHSLVVFSKRTPAHFMMVCHPRKTEFNRIESVDDIKGSSTAVQEAHNVFLFNRPSEEMISGGIEEGDRDLKIAKCRRRGKHVGKGVIFKWKDRTYSESSGYNYRSKELFKLGTEQLESRNIQIETIDKSRFKKDWDY